MCIPPAPCISRANLPRNADAYPPHQESEYVGEGFDYGDVVSLAEGARGADARGYRAEAIRLMELSGSVGEPGLVKR